MICFATTRIYALIIVEVDTINHNGNTLLEDPYKD